MQAKALSQIHQRPCFLLPHLCWLTFTSIIDTECRKVVPADLHLSQRSCLGAANGFT